MKRNYRLPSDAIPDQGALHYSIVQVVPAQEGKFHASPFPSALVSAHHSEAQHSVPARLIHS